ncbi:TPA: hypothetical protein EYP13_02945 [Candidatus Micrarchaeota archaeon]|nr:hypothetical protein [Candidatus Micrarchaeota archaeon]
MSVEYFTPGFHQVYLQVRRLFEYLKSGVLINRVSPDVTYLSGDPFLCQYVPYVRSGVYVDTPDREAVVAVLSRVTGGREKHYLLFHEDCHGVNTSAVLLGCTAREAGHVERLVRDFLEWYYREEHALLRERERFALAVLEGKVSQRDTAF